MKINEIKAALAARSAAIPTVNFGDSAPITDGANALAADPDTKSIPIIKIPTPSTNDTATPQTTPAQVKDKVDEAPKTPRRRSSRKPKTEATAPVTVETTITPTHVPQPSATHESIEQIIAKHLVQGRDYDLIPGVGRKPSLLKPGAEKLCEVFGYYTETAILHRVEMFEKGFIGYEVEVTVKDKDGRIVSQGLGSCNSRERKYLKQSFTDCANTVMKMAKKRAYVDAILTATHASGVFTQDIEDIARD